MVDGMTALGVGHATSASCSATLPVHDSDLSPIRLANWPGGSIGAAALGVCQAEGPHVIPAGHSGPSAGEEGSTAGVDFAELDGADSAGAGGEGKSSQPGKQVNVGSFIHAAFFFG
jgi:hypothetical protein